MYPIDDELYASLEPYIDLPDSLLKKNREQLFAKKEFDEPAKPVAFEINTADSATWVAVKGIGPAISRMIMNYRSKLGGFHSVEQLQEVYLVKEELMERIRPQLEVDASYVHKLNINKADAKELKSHPYISWNIANSIVRIRQNHGPYESVSDVQKSDLINDSTYRKLAPYFTID